ncbi:Lipase (class 3) [Eubacterium ruminantium]|nr:Lipase (class 3) [Eubacterium ruminantium]
MKIRRGRTKRRIALFLTALMVITMIPLVPQGSIVYAANPVFARIRLDGQWKMDLTDSIETLNEYISKNKDKTIRIDMLTDWNAAENGREDDFDEALIIPSDSFVTLNMHGHVFNRNNGWNDDSSYSGEMIRVESGATLTINGSSDETEKNMQHENVAVYTSANEGSKATGRITTTGGTITGGVSTRGAGGIYVKSEAIVNLNDVTIAGCCSRDSAGTNNGFGGGIWLCGEEIGLRMKDSRIVGCLSDDEGGGICVYDSNIVSIELNNTIIEENYASNNGGGICVNNDNIHINAINNSSLSNNKSGYDGGGLYLNDENESATGLIISGNTAGRNGGGIYLCDENESVSSCVITENTADERGGGIYVNDNNQTISECEIVNNTANMSGGGVYIYENVDTGFNISGKTVIKDNTGKMMGDNLYVSDDTPENTRIMFKLTKGAEVWMSYNNLGDRDYVMVTTGEPGDEYKNSKCIQYLHADNQGWHFGYDERYDHRKIYYVKDGHDPSGVSPVQYAPEPAVIKPEDAINVPGATGTDTKAGIVGKVGPGGEGTGDYDLIRSFYRHQETDNDTNDTTAAFYYSDAFFDSDPMEYNQHLATLSLNMAFAGMYLRAKEPLDENDNYYYNRHAAARQFMADIGCPDQNIYINESNEKKPQTDSIGVTIGSKMLSGDMEGMILVPIVVRGGGYELEWASNGTLNKAGQVEGKEAAGFSNAADQVENEIEKYIKKYSLDDELKEGRVKFWIAGYSRAGATSNLTAKRLVEKYASGIGEYGNNEVYAYTCEAPMGGTDDAEKLNDKTRYYCIHNLINAVDIVPLVAPGLMGFKRYGVDHYIPGTDAGEITSNTEKITRGGRGGVTSRTTYKDNERILVKQMDSDLKDSMQNQLMAVDSGIILDDYFHPMVLNIFPSTDIFEKGIFDNNHVEEFIIDFIRFAQEGIDKDDHDYEWSQAIPNRDKFAEDIQPAIRDLFAMIFSMSPEDSAGFIGRASSIAERIPTISIRSMNKLFIYDNIFKNFGWHNLSDERKDFFCTGFWEKLEETGALEYLSEEDAAKLEKNWPKLFDFLMTLAEADYNYQPGPVSSWAGESSRTFMLLATFATYATFILQNHYPEVNLAWARTYDSFYDNETTEYVIPYQEEAAEEGYEVKAPDAFGKVIVSTIEEGFEKTEEQKVLLQEGIDKNNILSGDQKIILENTAITGEAVYYYLEDNDLGERLTTNLLYRGGIDITLGSEMRRSFTIIAYSISYGVTSREAFYNVTLVNDRHKVSVADGSDNGTKEYLYKAGNKVSINAIPEENSFFKKWTVELLDKDGNTVAADIADSLLTDEESSYVNSSSATFTMPDAGAVISGESSVTYPEEYALRINAICADRITNIVILTIPPTSGDELLSDAIVQLGDKVGAYPINWSYIYEEDDGNGSIVVKNVPASGAAYNDTVYRASVTVPQDIADDIVFAPDIVSNVSIDHGTVMSTYRNDADGSVTVIIEYEKTTSTGGEIRPDANIKLTIKALDLNMGTYTESASEDYHVLQNTEVMLTAPDVENELFVKWDFGNTGIIPAEGYNLANKVIKVIIPDDLTVDVLEADAQYVPVINEILAAVKNPAGGQTMQTEADEYTLTVIISNLYQIHPDYVRIAWTPEVLNTDDDIIADYLTNYTVTISIEPAEDERGKYIYAKRPEDSEYVRTAAVFFYSEEVLCQINGEIAVCDKTHNSISYTFPMTQYTLVSVGHPSDISGIPNGADEDAISELLPDSLKILLDNGNEADALVVWDLEKGNQEDDRDAVTWTATASVSLPDTVEDKDNVLDEPITVRINVLSAEHAKTPKASLESGEFITSQETELITREPDGITYYAVGNNDSYTEYSGEPIDIKRDDPHLVDEIAINEEGQQVATGRKILYLRAYTKLDGKYDSNVVTYAYIFGDKKTGNDFTYTVEENVVTAVPSGQSDITEGLILTLLPPENAVYNGDNWQVVLNDFDKAVFPVVGDIEYYKGETKLEGAPVDAGTYTAAVTVGEGDKAVTARTEFTIAAAQFNDSFTFKKGSSSLKYTGSRLKTAVKVIYNTGANSITLEKGKDYTVTYSDNLNVGTAKITVKGIGNYAGEKVLYFKIVTNLTANPKNQTVNCGKTAVFSAVQDSQENLTYEWQVSQDSGNTWKKSGVSGQGTASINVTAKANYDGYMFRCKISNGTWTEYTKPAKLNVNAVITEEPVDKAAYYGNVSRLTVKAIGPDMHYQWQTLNANNKWVNSSAPGADTAVLSVTATAALNGRKFRCVITSKGKVLTTKEVTLKTVNNIRVQPVSKTIKAGTAAVFTVKAVGNNVSYQWQVYSNGKWVKSGAEGCTTNTLKVSGNVKFNGYKFRCLVTNGTVKTYSDVVTLNIK